MCGIGAIVHLDGRAAEPLEPQLAVMNRLLAHRGPDGEGTWVHPRGHAGFAHRRLEIIDLATGDQPMTDGDGNWITYNGEIYNYRELRRELGEEQFRTTSDTEVVLRAYRRWGPACLERLRGMFAFVLWDEGRQELFCARDRFGIKPLYYAVVDGTFICASEAKALLPFLPAIETDLGGLKDYLTFQFCLAGKTLFRGIDELLPGHTLTVGGGSVRTARYWEVHFHPDFDHTERWFASRLRELVEDSVRFHLRADVPVGAYLSGGLDSSITTALAARAVGRDFQAFTGRFSDGERYDESGYARMLAERDGFRLHEVTIDAHDFVDSIDRVLYHLDYPVAGPGSFPQYMVAGLASEHMKVVLGGQGGDEIFGGYARYLLAYFEQCIKGAIDGTMHDGNFIVTYESIIPQLSTLREYKPLMQEFWRDGLFADLDARYFRLVDRASNLGAAIDWRLLGDYSPFETFAGIFRADNVGHEAYFDSMTHFDFKTLLPALLHVEDRMSMAHGLESRVPFVDADVVEFAATLPADVKFKHGHLKHALKEAVKDVLPAEIVKRRDKMGFPVPFGEWIKGELRDFVLDTFTSESARRPYFNPRFDIEAMLQREGMFGRNVWALLCLELWQQRFHDRQTEWHTLARADPVLVRVSRA
ncbi:MAG TPA: asparagine synthase (glutamine-hydrolyzing) [Gaiellaceae bacterium]|nr:asparagine synthase (glutamine-hydrolyzing) [Gaiellaceae bacterium]